MRRLIANLLLLALLNFTVAMPTLAQAHTEINSASKSEIMNTLQVTKEEAVAIIANRPYWEVDDVRLVIPDATFQRIRPRIRILPPDITVDANAASIGTLMSVLKLGEQASFAIIEKRPYKDQSDFRTKVNILPPVKANAIVVFPLDVNIADKNQLDKLGVLGLSNTQIDKIIRGRPFNSTEDLITRGIIDQNAHNQIKDFTRAIYRPSEIPGSVFFFIGAEYTLEDKAGQKNFAKPFPFLGLRANYMKDLRGERGKERDIDLSLGKFRTQLDFRLVSTAVEKFDPTNPANTNLSAERSFDSNVTVAWMVFNTDRRTDYHGLSSWEIGPVIKIGGQTTETEQNFFWRTMAGLRFMETGDILNGTYFDVGYGYSGNFLQPKYRMKVEGYLPIYAVGIPLFLQTTLETDFGSKPDLVKIAFGTFFSPTQILDKLKKVAGS